MEITEKNKITDKEYWDNYWSNYQYDKVPEKVVFEKYIPLLAESENFIEIGGFPGVFATTFFRRGIKNVTILDYYINKKIVRNFEQINGLPPETIKCIESDFFAFSSDKKYDVVFSYGFIEHFENTQDVISRHIDMLSDKGKLLILIPNFLGLNGMIQRKFDRQNLDAHNLKSMEIPYIEKIMNQFNFSDVVVEYIGKPMLWLEPKPENIKKRKWIKMLSYVVKLFPFKGKYLSPFIAIYARK
jgi:2-polyprenyl-3-methyl-5-hydroxy-6-metoxy-1,4-benzoquinol methylase